MDYIYFMEGCNVYNEHRLLREKTKNREEEVKIFKELIHYFSIFNYAFILNKGTQYGGNLSVNRQLQFRNGTKGF